MNGFAAAYAARRRLRTKTGPKPQVAQDSNDTAQADELPMESMPEEILTEEPFEEVSPVAQIVSAIRRKQRPEAE